MKKAHIKAKPFLIVGVLVYLAHHDWVTTKQVANHFEVSQRTILRYIDSLSFVGVQVESKVGLGGGIRLVKDFSLEKLFFSDEEIATIKTALQTAKALDPAIVGNIMKEFS